MQNSKTCNTFFSYNDVCNQLVKFHGDPLYLKIVPYSPAMSGLNFSNPASSVAKRRQRLWGTITLLINTTNAGDK